MEKQKVYIETSVISYLTAKPIRDIIIAAHQELTRYWWDVEKDKFDLFISELVINEAGAGDANAAELRLSELNDLPLLDIDDRVIVLTKAILSSGVVPQKAAEDALHISIATVHRIDYLLTWNCKHIANAIINNQLRKIITENGYLMPVICTPNELLTE
ncbi:MAG: type II toxin-antitoxin system VapC family toxin [bacterium]